MNIPGVYQREKRHPSQMYHPMHHSVANYWTEAFQKREMKHDFNDDLFLNNIHLIPDPLKKNLADSLFNTETTKPEKMFQRDKMAQNCQEVPLESPPKQTTLGGIGNFFSGVMNVLTSVMFRSRASTYYDCFDVDSQGQSWQHASTDVQDKNGQADDCISYGGPPNPNVSSEMNFDSRHAVTGCERKLNQVLNLLAPRQTSSPVWVRKRPKKVFVEPGSVEESFEDAFSPEDFSSIPNESYIEYYSPVQYQCEELSETAAQKTKLNMAPVEVEEQMDIIKDVTKTFLEKENMQLVKDNMQLKQDNMQLEQQEVQLEQQKVQLNHEKVELDQQKVQLEQQELKKCDSNMEKQSENTLQTEKTEESSTIKDHLVNSSSSCEDKLLKLKALLQGNRMKCRNKHEIPETSQTSVAQSPPKTIKNTKPADKRFKNPNRRCGKRTKTKLKCRIEDDLVFANEISIGTPPSVENSPMERNVNFGEYFDEVSGRFRTNSTGSDDSFQIVFNDSMGRLRKSSDCDSEDSFIVFEDSPESCYVSNDVFDSDSDSESDSGCGITCKLAHTLTRTVSNLADDSLYVSDDEDEVDFGMGTVDVAEEKTGLLMDERKKQLRKCQPCKKVRFSTDPPRVHVMRVWAFAARQARAGHWERYSIDRERFKKRIADADMALSWVLKPQHRCRVMFQRFMPWWNQLKRKELAEKKEKEDEEKRRREQRQDTQDVQIKEDNTEEEVKDSDDLNKKSEDLGENNKSNSNLKEDLRSNTEEKCLNVKTDSQKENAEEVGVISPEDNKGNKQVEFNNNLNINNGKISSKFIENDALAKKIKDLEDIDNSNIEIVSS